tara:strand:+ start:9030 stop:9212 length:183 start_codon:yes stop_codon:yes gene_type:complete
MAVGIPSFFPANATKFPIVGTANGTVDNISFKYSLLSFSSIFAMFFFYGEIEQVLHYFSM